MGASPEDRGGGGMAAGFMGPSSATIPDAELLPLSEWAPILGATVNALGKASREVPLLLAERRMIRHRVYLSAGTVRRWLDTGDAGQLALLRKVAG